MPNNMQPHPFVFMLYVQRQKFAHCEWHAFVNEALNSNTTGRRELIKGSITLPPKALVLCEMVDRD